MFCIHCGEPINDGELICKGCSNVTAGVRDELLSLSEKTNNGDQGLKCKNCGADIKAGYHFCNKCGTPTAQ